MTDDMRGTHLSGATEWTGQVQGVQGGDGGGIFGGENDDTSWEGDRGETDLENLVHGRRAADVSHDLPGKGNPAELPGGGIPRPSGDKGGDAGLFSTPECPGNRGNFGVGKPPHPHLPLCNMLVHCRTLNGRHPATTQCARKAKQKRRRLAEAEMRDITERAYEAYGKPLENVTACKYMVQVLTAGDDDWPAVVGNLSKARKSWGRLSRILSREEADPKVLGHFFKSVSQAVFLFEAETWLLTPRMDRALDSF